MSHKTRIGNRKKVKLTMTFFAMKDYFADFYVEDK